MQSDKPHILLIILDTLRRDHLSIYGHQRNTSPEFDTFANDATLFTHAVSPAQWTVPAHGSLFTGLYASAHQLTQANSRLSGMHPTLAEILSVGGYHTVGFCNNPLVGLLNNGLQRGFNEFYNYSGAAPNRPIDAHRPVAVRTFLRNFRKVGRRIGNLFAHSDWLFRMSLNPRLVPIWTRLINYKGNTERSVHDVLDYWRAYHAGGAQKPLFTFLNLMGAHLPYHPSREMLQRVAPEFRHDARSYHFMNEFNADAARWASPPETPFESWEHAVLDAFYDAEIAFQDIQLGYLLRQLKASGALDNTLVIIAADHGEGHGDHHFFGHGFVVYQELVHVPLVMYHRERFPSGRRITTNLSTRRIFHTVLDCAELRPPIDETDPNANITQLSLARVVEGAPDSEENTAFSEAIPPLTFLNVLKHRSPALIERLRLMQTRRAIYHGDYKLVIVGEQIEGLFHIPSDPLEEHNLASNQPNISATLQEQLKQFVLNVTGQTNMLSSDLDMNDEIVDNLRALGYID